MKTCISKRKLLFIILCCSLFLYTPLYATNWVKADSKVIVWDPPLSYSDGTPLPADLQGFTYFIYTKGVNGQNIEQIGTLSIEQATITLSEGSKKFVGVSAMYIDVDGIQSDESEIAWSDNPVDCQGGVTFGIHNLKRPNKPRDMHP